jgi:hypothetical protein
MGPGIRPPCNSLRIAGDQRSGGHGEGGEAAQAVENRFRQRQFTVGIFEMKSAPALV